MSPRAAGERRTAAPGHELGAESFEALGILNELETLLREEQKAVAAYDVAALERLNAAKEDAARRLATAHAPALAPFRAAARRVAALAEANAAMLGASVAAVTQSLGLRPVVATYDSRARLRQRMPSVTARVV